MPPGFFYTGLGLPPAFTTITTVGGTPTLHGGRPPTPLARTPLRDVGKHIVPDEATSADAALAAKTEVVAA